MRTFAVLLILSLFLIQSGGFLLLFKIYEFQISTEIRNNIKTGIPNDELVIFRIPNSSLESFKENFVLFEDDEFRLEDKMYDVVRMERNSEETIYYCVPDTRESELYSRLDQLVNKSLSDDPLKKKLNSNFQIFLSALFFDQPQQMKFEVSCKKINPLLSTFSIESISPECLSPPPRKTSNIIV